MNFYTALTQYLSIKYIRKYTGIMSRNEVNTFEVSQCKFVRILPVRKPRPCLGERHTETKMCFRKLLCL